MIYGLTPITLVAIGSAGPTAGASCTIRDRLSGVTVTVYANEQGSATIAQPLTSTTAGALVGYLPRGRYAASFSGAGITPYIENFDTLPAEPNLTTPLIAPPGSVISALSLITATPGIKFPDGVVQLIAFPGYATPINSVQGTLPSSLYATPVQNVPMQFSNQAGYATPVGIISYNQLPINLYATPIQNVPVQYANQAGYATPVGVIAYSQLPINLYATPVQNVIIQFANQAGYATPIGILQSMLPREDTATPLIAAAPSNTPSTNLPYGPAITSLGLIQATPGIRYSDGTVQITAPVASTFAGYATPVQNVPVQFANQAGYATPVGVISYNQLPIGLYATPVQNVPMQFANQAGYATPVGAISYNQLPIGLYATPVQNVPMQFANQAGYATPVGVLSYNQLPIGLYATPVQNVSMQFANQAGYATPIGITTGMLPSDIAFIDMADAITGQYTFATPINTSYTAGAWLRGGLISATPGVVYPDGSVAINSGIYIDARNYGVVGDGVTDNASALDKFTQALASKGPGSIGVLPVGTVLTSTPISFRGSGTWIKGWGRKATIIQKTASFNLFQIYGTTPGYIAGPLQHKNYVGISEMSINGNNNAGRLIDAVYADNIILRDLYMYQNNGVGIDFVEVWDSLVDNVTLEDVNSVKDPVIWIRSSRATPGGLDPGCSILSDSDMIRINNCRVESWKAGALRIEVGQSGQHHPNLMYIHEFKAESVYVRGNPIYIDSTADVVNMKDIYISMNGFDAGFSTAQDGIGFYPSVAGSLRDVHINNQLQATTKSGVDIWTGAPVHLSNVSAAYQTAPTSGAHVNFAGGGPYFISNNCHGQGPAGFTDFKLAAGVQVYGIPLASFATPMTAVAPSTLPTTNQPYAPALTSIGPIAATPGIVFPDGTALTSSGYRGLVNSAGTVISGTGFTVFSVGGTTISTRHFVNFAANPLFATPVIDVTPWSAGAGNLGQANFSDPGRNGFTVYTASATGTATPFGFSFTAVI